MVIIIAVILMVIVGDPKGAGVRPHTYRPGTVDWNGYIAFTLPGSVTQRVGVERHVVLVYHVHRGAIRPDSLGSVVLRLQRNVPVTVPRPIGQREPVNLIVAGIQCPDCRPIGPDTKCLEVGTS